MKATVQCKEKQTPYWVSGHEDRLQISYSKGTWVLNWDKVTAF